MSAQVDQRIWPRPLTAETAPSLSGALAVALRQLHEARGGAILLPGSAREPRFVVDSGGVHPSCRHREDIHITVDYAPRDDGTPFAFRYRIAQGQAVREGSLSRDLGHELRTGELRFLNIDEPIQLAIAEDIRARAALILDQMSLSER